jgi:hypothetical protein
MFSVTDTSWTPERRRAALIATWSSIERARRSNLVHDDRSDPAVCHPTKQRLEVRTIRRPGGLAGVDEFARQVPSPIDDVSKAASRWAGIE